MVYGPFASNGNCVKPPKSVVDYLRRNKIERVFVGHAPVGDCVNVIRNEGKKGEKGVTVFCCDTSYSGGGNRGEAWCGVWIGEGFTFITGGGLGEDVGGGGIEMSIMKDVKSETDGLGRWVGKQVGEKGGMELEGEGVFVGAWVKGIVKMKEGPGLYLALTEGFGIKKRVVLVQQEKALFDKLVKALV